MSEEAQGYVVSTTDNMSGIGPDLFAALSAAQGEIEGAAKGKTNPHFKSKYADLASIWDACRAPLSKHGLCVIQRPAPCESGHVAIETVLAHKSGQWIGGTLVMRPAKADPQGIGSTITYARRYALASMVGVAPDDDDGNAASGVQSAEKTITEAEAADVVAMAEEADVPVLKLLDVVSRNVGFPVTAVNAIPAKFHERTLAYLEKARGA